MSAETPLTGEQLDDMTPQVCPAGVHPDWAVDSEDSHTCPWCQVADLSDQLAGARRTVDEQQDEIQQLRSALRGAADQVAEQDAEIAGLRIDLAARPSRADVLRAAADGVALEMVPETPGAGPGFLLAVRLIVRHLRQLADTAGSEGR